MRERAAENPTRHTSRPARTLMRDEEEAGGDTKPAEWAPQTECAAARVELEASQARVLAQLQLAAAAMLRALAAQATLRAAPRRTPAARAPPAGLASSSRA
jgi:hypothetical protein